VGEKREEKRLKSCVDSFFMAEGVLVADCERAGHWSLIHDVISRQTFWQLIYRSKNISNKHLVSNKAIALAATSTEPHFGPISGHLVLEGS